MINNIIGHTSVKYLDRRIQCKAVRQLLISQRLKYPERTWNTMQTWTRFQQLLTSHCQKRRPCQKSKLLCGRNPIKGSIENPRVWLQHQLSTIWQGQHIFSWEKILKRLWRMFLLASEPSIKWQFHWFLCLCNLHRVNHEILLGIVQHFSCWEPFS